MGKGFLGLALSGTVFRSEISLPVRKQDHGKFTYSEDLFIQHGGGR